MINYDFKNKIATLKLTKVEKKIANFIINNSNEICFMTSTEMANAIGVSNASIIRFTKKLNFKGYAEFIKSFQENLITNNRVIPKNIQNPVERLEKINSTKDIFDINFKNIIENIDSIKEKNSNDDFNKAIKIILNSENKYIYGSRSRLGLAEFFSLILSHMVSNVKCYSSNSFTPFDFISEIKKNDCIIILSFPRYSNIDYLVSELAYENNSKIILITNEINTKLTPYADVILLVDIESNNFFNSYTSVLFLIEIICSKISNIIGNTNKDKLKIIDKYISKLGMY